MPEPARESAASETAASEAGARATRHGAGRVLIAVYAVFALSATARALYQLVAQYARAPGAYWLSALSGAVYVVATAALSRATVRAWRVAVAAVGVELVGVLAVGTLTAVRPHLLGDASVWTDYGSGYGYVPLVLPLLGLAWLARTRPGRAARPAPR